MCMHVCSDVCVCVSVSNRALFVYAHMIRHSCSIIGFGPRLSFACRKNPLAAVLNFSIQLVRSVARSDGYARRMRVFAAHALT